MAEQSFLRGRLGRNYSNKWIVPVHGTFAERNCHHEIGPITASLNAVLIAAKRNCSSGSIETVIEEATRHHNIGSGSISQLLKFIALEESVDDFPENMERISRIVTLIYATGPGLRWGDKANLSRLWRAPIRRNEKIGRLNRTELLRIEGVIHDHMLSNPRFRINLAKLTSSQKGETWKRHLEAANALVKIVRGEERESILINIKRATASICLHRPGFTVREKRAALANGREVLAGGDSEFVRQTANVIMTENSSKYPDICKEDVRDWSGQTLQMRNLAWTHRHNAMFHRGISLLEGIQRGESIVSKHKSFTLLTQAHYIGAMMGLGPIELPTGGRDLFGRCFLAAYPANFLTTDLLERMSVKTKAHAEAMRTRCLNPLRRELIAAIYGHTDLGNELLG